jgi:hypothetical protein
VLEYQKRDRRYGGLSAPVNGDAKATDETFIVALRSS